MLLAVLGAGGYAAWYVRSPVGMAAESVEVEVPPGTRLRGTIALLQRSGVQVKPSHFEALARALGRERDIKAGNYLLTQPITPIDLLDKLTRGDVTQAEIRLIEGWTFAQFRAALDANPDLKHDTTGVEDGEILKRIQATENHPEGLFFPDTYLFARGSSELAIFRRAYRAMHRHLENEWNAKAPNAPYKSPYEALIMASIIEKETGRPEERDEIGGVLVNRLRIGMRLQVDPTIIYGLGASFDGNLKRTHLTEDGPYNTYTRAGLPPGPIASPGAASLKAAAEPDKVDYLFYVRDDIANDGSHRFARTLAEHEANIRRYQK